MCIGDMCTGTMCSSEVQASAIAGVGGKRARPSSDASVEVEAIHQSLLEYVKGCRAVTAVPFALGNYSSIGMASSACCKSLVVMIPLLTLMFKLVPTGLLAHCALSQALLMLAMQEPTVNTGTKSVQDWSQFMSAKIRVALAHCRKLVQIPQRFAQRTKKLSADTELP